MITILIIKIIIIIIRISLIIIMYNPKSLYNNYNEYYNEYPHYYHRCSQCFDFHFRWIGIRLELLGNVIVLLATIFCLVSEDLNGAQVGLSISYAVMVNIKSFLVRSVNENACTFSLNYFIFIF